LSRKFKKMEMNRETGSILGKQSLVQNIGLATPVVEVDVEGGKRCRKCGSTDNQAGLIAPCLCAGRQRYVHRACLDRERVYSHAPKSFTECNTCHYEYWIDHKKPEATKECCECKKASLLIARDSIGGIIFIQLTLMAIAWLIAIVDNGFTRIIPADCCPQAQYNFYTWDTGNNQCPGLCGSRDAQGGPLLNSMPRWIAQHTKTAYFLMALFVVWFVIATIGVLKLSAMDKNERGRSLGGGFAALFCCCFCAECCAKEAEERNPALGAGWGNNGYGNSYGGSSCGNCNCNCSSSNCNCSGGGGEALAIIAVVIVALFLAFIFLSFFMGFLIIMGLISKLIQNHFTILKRKELVKEFIVMDCDEVQLAPDADGRAILAPDYDGRRLSEFNIR
jgi:hypothetical protein